MTLGECLAQWAHRFDDDDTVTSVAAIEACDGLDVPECLEGFMYAMAKLGATHMLALGARR